MDTGAEALARRAQRFGNAPAAAVVEDVDVDDDDIGDIDEEARLAELMQLRAAERKEAEQEGVLSSGKTRLEEAKDLVGTCPGMISEYQYYWRKLRYNNIHSLEKDEHGEPQWYLTIKDYARSAAGNEQELPSDVRPPNVLLRTTDYLLTHILTTHPFTPINQAFIRDRARAIVKDFTMQHVRNAPAIDAHERIVRMAALSMHIFRDQRQPDGPFDHDGERKQFVNALSSLTQFYADARNPTLRKTYISQTHVSLYEPEFTAYWHLFSLRRPPAMPDSTSPSSPPSTNDDPTYPTTILTHPLFRLARTFITLWAQSEHLITSAENMLLSPKERAAKEARAATQGVHRFKRPAPEDIITSSTADDEDEENWRPQRFEYPPGFAFPALGLLRRLADPGMPWVLAAVLEASALDDVRARALWEVWQMRRGEGVLVSELVDLFGCDGPDDVRAIVDTVAEASGRAVRKLRTKGSDEIRAYRLVGSMKCTSLPSTTILVVSIKNEVVPSHFPRARRNTKLIDSKRPTHAQLVDVVNQAWDRNTNGYELTVEDVPELVLPDRVDIEETDSNAVGVGAGAPVVVRGASGVGSSNGGAAFGTGIGAGAFGTGIGTAGTGTSTNGVFAGFGAVQGGKPNPFSAPAATTVTTATANGGGAKANPFGGASTSANPFGGAASSTNPFGGASATNPFGGASTSNPFGGATSAKPNPFGGTPSTSNPFSGASTSTSNPFGGTSTTTPNPLSGTSTTPNPFGGPTTSASNPFGAKPPSGALGLTNGNGKSNFGAGTSAFGAGAGAFGVGSGAFGTKPLATPAPTTSELTTPAASAPVQPFKPASPPISKLSPFAANFVPKFGVPPAPAISPPRPPVVRAPEAPVPSFSPAPPTVVPEAEPVEDTSAAEAAKAAREAKLKEKIEAVKREEARLRAEEARRAEERRKQEELKRHEEEARIHQEEVERQRFKAEQQRLEAQEQAEREQQARAARQRQEDLHATTAQLLLGDILEILVVPEVQYAIEHEKRNRMRVRRAFEWWKARAAKRAKRRQVLENMGLGRVGVAGAAGEVGELFDEEDEEVEVSYQRKRTISLREHRTDAELAAAMAKAAAERERLWAPGVFFDITKQAVANVADGQGKTLDDVPGWDIWLCTSGANKSSAEWLRKKLNARPTQLVDGTVSIAAITPSVTKKDSAPGLVIFECSPYLGAAMNETEWSNAWSDEAGRIARLFSAMSNHSSYMPSLLFVVWSTDHVAQHAEAITRKIKKAASHLADVSIQGGPAVAVLVDDTVEEVFEEALASLELDIEGRPLVEQSSVTESLSRQISAWHRALAHILGRIPTFDDEDNAFHLAQVILALIKAFNVMVAGVLQLCTLKPQNAIYLPEFHANAAQDTRSLYNLADTYTSSLSFAETVDLNVLRSAIRQYRHSGKAFPARFFCERLAQLVDIALTPLVSGNRPRPDVHAAENTFEAALADAMISLDARAKKRTQDGSPVRDNKKARLVSTDTPTKPKENGDTVANSGTSGAAKLRALLDKTRNRWATETDGA
ncbi:hypothetical protein FRC12_017813 [Ceratobasidium sp. 428]|nr:hypothetical protein FRC12_017813 [Ceratobasidium sp. 428]